MNDVWTRGFSIGMLVTAGLSVGCGTDDPNGVGGVPAPDSGVTADAGKDRDAGSGTDAGDAGPDAGVDAGPDAGVGQAPVITRVAWRPERANEGEQCTPGEPWKMLIDVTVEDPDTPQTKLYITGRVGACGPLIDGFGSRTFEVTCQQLGQFDASLDVVDAPSNGNKSSVKVSLAACETGSWPSSR